MIWILKKSLNSYKILLLFMKVNNFIRFIILLCIICIINSPLLSQNESNSYINSNTSGFLIGYSFVDEMLPEGNSYHPINLIYNYTFPLKKKQVDNKSNLFLQFEPQINPVFINNGKNAIEFGVNVGLLYHLMIADDIILFAGIGSGPHFISINTKLQSSGFIFSDNLILGYRRCFKSWNKPLELNVQLRFRHISNAGIKEPNTGIDNFFILIGLSKIVF